MDQDPQVIQSPFFDEKIFKKQIEIIREASAEAQKAIDYETAHNEEILRAIDVVEDFLRRKHRLCYGGQAINAHLPRKYKFYDPRYNVPDYDVFTPDQDEDIRSISKELRRAGFTEIGAREGIHEGTIKIYVNFVPVLDLTAIDSRLYKILSEKEYKVDGISYLDANTLRMLMYLELSRPQGEVERWGKVYERLLLLNHFAPVEPCKIRYAHKDRLSEREVDAVMDYVVHEKRIFAGADLVGYYRTGLKKGIGRAGSANWLLKTQKPIIVYTSDLKKDTEHFRYEFRHLSPETPVKVQKIEALGGDLIPQMSWFLRGSSGVPVLILISLSACHSYYNIPLKNNETLLAATLDTLITLYFSISLLQYKNMDLKGIGCLAQELVEISYRARMSPDKFPFPFVSLNCSGHQKGISSLIRERVRRITANKKRKLQDLIQSRQSLRNQTARRTLQE